MHHWIDPLETRRLFATVPTGFTDSAYGSGFNVGTAMQFAPDGRLIVTRQNGEVRIIDANGALLPTPAITLTVNFPAGSERGLLGLALDPNFSSNGYIYLYYTAPTPTIHNRISRFTMVGNTISPASEVILMDQPTLSGATNHNGGAMHVGPDGKLYIAVGDNANSANSQSLTTPMGKMLRINLDGSIPTDNPFYAAPVDINDSIWALGLRNPYTFAIQPGTGKMLINDVGQSAYEEINLGAPAANYGWPATEGDFNQASFPSYTRPVYSYGRTIGQAITGGAFYNPAVSRLPLSYVGKYFFADYSQGWIKTIDPNSPPATDTAPSFLTGASQPVDIRIGPDSAIYYLQRGSGNGGAGVRRVTTAPVAINSQQFIVDGASPKAHLMQFVFSRDVAGSIQGSDLVLTDLDTMTQIPPGQIGVDYTPATRTANFFYTGSATGALPEGRYRAVLPAGSVDDALDIPTMVNGQIYFHVLPGDADGDRIVNTTDFNRLAGNFGLSGKLFSEGNFDYLGNVDSEDFNLLIGSYGTRLDSPAAPLPAQAPLFQMVEWDRSDRLLPV